MDYKNFTKQIHNSVETSAPSERIWEEIELIGGRRGWYYLNWLWQLRGALDLLVGGPGMRRRLERQRPLAVGGVVDCYRISAAIPQRKLTLVAEMKLPGEGVMEFNLTPLANGRKQLDVAIYFQPVSLFGAAYWYSLVPMHDTVLGGLLRTICRRAEVPNEDNTVKCPS